MKHDIAPKTVVEINSLMAYF